ncbi:hypothetical protein AX289_00205 [Methylorubrum populi]|nr:hypothetical protein AX289_00205 [Methylorubrum populi]
MAREVGLEWLKNISLNMRATGPAAVLCVYLLVMGAVGIFGNGPHTGMVTATLSFLGPILIGALAQRV